MNIQNPRPPQFSEKEMRKIRRITSNLLRYLIQEAWYQAETNLFPYFFIPHCRKGEMVTIQYKIYDSFKSYEYPQGIPILLGVESIAESRCGGKAISGFMSLLEKNPPLGYVQVTLHNFTINEFMYMTKFNNKTLDKLSVIELRQYLDSVSYEQNRLSEDSNILDEDDDWLHENYIEPAQQTISANNISLSKIRRYRWEQLFLTIYHELVHHRQKKSTAEYIQPEKDMSGYVSQFVELQPSLAQIIQELKWKRKPIFYQRKISLSEYLLKYSSTFEEQSKDYNEDALIYILQGTYQWLKENNLVLLQNPRKEIEFAEGFDSSMTSKGLRKHIEEGLGLPDSFFRLGSKAYLKMFKEIEAYWDKNNVILRGPTKWMIENLEVGTPAIFDGERVFLDVPFRGGQKKFIVYHNSGRTNSRGEIIAKKIEWGDPNLTVKNDQYNRSKSFWNRQGCDGYYKKSGKKTRRLDPSTAGFWACYGPTLFASQLELQSDMPW